MPRRRRRDAKMRIPYNGEWGKYEIDEHLTVEYIMTTVHLGTETEKLRYIKPVREVLDLDELPFEHLLQRDLDDSRTSEEIINGYLADNSNDLPIFFPPLTVALLPSNDDSVSGYYPPKNEIKNNDEVKWKFGEAFDIDFFLDENEERETGVRLNLNPTLTYQLAIDGQHRLMAIKASALGVDDITEIYRPLYQGVEAVDLSETSVPVCFLYFPELTSDRSSQESRDLIRSSRRLFLDVNKNARKPAKSREILLDDYDLVNYFTSKIFSKIKNKQGTNEGLRLYHTEYDTPSRRTKMTRPLAILDVLNIQDVISYVLMSKSDVKNEIGSKDRKPGDSSQLRKELETQDRIPKSFFDSLDVDKGSFTKDNLPKPLTQKISSQCFEPYWGNSILYVYENLYPFSVHLAAVDELYDSKTGSAHENSEGEANDDEFTERKLARAMLFEGQGLWWIVQSKAEHESISDDDKVSKAVDIAQSWVDEFEAIRAEKYLKQDTVTEGDIHKVNNLYGLFRSKAFQIAVFMSIALLKEESNSDLDELSQIVEWFVDSINDRFSYQANSVRTVLFDREYEDSLRNRYKPRRLSKTDWPFLRNVLISLLKGK